MCLCAVFYLRKDIVDKMLFDGEAVHLVLGREYLIVPYGDKSDDP